MSNWYFSMKIICRQKTGSLNSKHIRNQRINQGGNPLSKTIYPALKTHDNPASSLAADKLVSFFSTLGEKIA